MHKKDKRRFLVVDATVLDGQRGFPIVRGYLAKESSLVEVRTFGSFAFLTIRGKSDEPDGLRFEYPIPLEDALAMLECHCSPRVVSKTRHLIPYADRVIEVDVFEGKHAGLTLAEIALEGLEALDALPAWLGEDITENPGYEDFALAHSESVPHSGARP